MQPAESERFVIPPNRYLATVPGPLATAPGRPAEVTICPTCAGSGRVPGAVGGPGTPELSPGTAAISVHTLSKRYGDQLAVDALTFSLQPGTITGFLGPNGAGKSTTMRMLLGLVAPTAGQALVLGQTYAEFPDPACRVGAMLESGDFDPGRSGRNHLRVLALAIGVPRARVEELLDVVGLRGAAARAVKTYSLGMRQRLGLAGSLLGDPEVLILDEPANGLDPQGVAWLRGFLRQFADGGGTVLISSHVLAEVARIAESVVIMHRGRLVAMLSPDDLAAGEASLEEVYLDLTADVPA